MQNQAAVALIFSFLILSIGCNNKNQSFEDAIAQQKNSPIAQNHQVGEGLPFFVKKTLTPTWDSQDIVEIPQFSLLNQSGVKVDKSIFQKKVSIVGFIFTSCMGFCPLLVSKMKAMEERVKHYPELQLVAFTVDPEVDTPKRLLEYGKKHKLNTGSRWNLLTGDKNAIFSLSRDTFASEVRQLDAKNMRKFAHTEHFYIIDQQGRLRGIVNGTRRDMLDEAESIINSLASANKLVKYSPIDRQ